MFRCYKGEAPKYLCELLDIEVRTGTYKSLRSYEDEVISYRIPFAKHKPLQIDCLVWLDWRYGIVYQ